MGIDLNGTPTVFAEGVRNDVELTERQILGETSAIFSGISKHKLRVGAGAYIEEIDDVEDRRNFIIGPRGLLISTGVFTDTGTLGVSVAQPEKDRTVVYGFIQDEWAFLPDWSLTAGIRIDTFSNAGTSINPRVGLIWNADLQATLKLLAGRAFRAPAFIEAFSQNNLIAEGNPDLNPETLTSVELSFDQRWFDGHATVTAYWLEIEDQIQILPDSQAAPVFLRFANAGKQKGYGLELSAGWVLWPALSITGHYALQDTEDQETGQDAGIAPRHKLYAEINWEPQRNWYVNLNLLSVVDRARQPGDPREDIDDYTWVNLYLQRKDIYGHIDIGVGASNLFDNNAREPSTSPAALPNDIPLEGRSVFGEITAKF